MLREYQMEWNADFQDWINAFQEGLKTEWTREFAAHGSANCVPLSLGRADAHNVRLVLPGAKEEDRGIQLL